MRFLKNQTLSKYGLTENSLRIFERPAGHTDQGSRIVMDLTGALRLPKGTSDQRPSVSGVTTPEGANGYIRYNTSIDPVTLQQVGIEAYVNGVWEVVRAPGTSTITKQTLGPGDYVNDVFGPLDIVPATADNIIVLVENVFQISVTNFTLDQNPTAGSGEEIVATALVSGDEYIIVSPGTTDFTVVGAADNNIGTVFTADLSGGPATGDGLVRETGYYLTFQEPVPLDKYITIYYGYAN
jgi:hypothetical protein